MKRSNTNPSPTSILGILDILHHTNNEKDKLSSREVPYYEDDPVGRVKHMLQRIQEFDEDFATTTISSMSSTSPSSSILPSFANTNGILSHLENDNQQSILSTTNSNTRNSDANEGSTNNGMFLSAIETTLLNHFSSTTTTIGAAAIDPEMDYFQHSLHHHHQHLRKISRDILNPSYHMETPTTKHTDKVKEFMATTTATTTHIDDDKDDTQIGEEENGLNFLLAEVLRMAEEEDDEHEITQEEIVTLQQHSPLQSLLLETTTTKRIASKSSVIAIQGHTIYQIVTTTSSRTRKTTTSTTTTKNKKKQRGESGAAISGQNGEYLRRIRREWKDAVRLGIGYDWIMSETVTLRSWSASSRTGKPSTTPDNYNHIRLGPWLLLNGTSTGLALYRNAFTSYNLDLGRHARIRARFVISNPLTSRVALLFPVR